MEIRKNLNLYEKLLTNVHQEIKTKCVLNIVIQKILRPWNILINYSVFWFSFILDLSHPITFRSHQNWKSRSVKNLCKKQFFKDLLQFFIRLITGINYFLFIDIVLQIKVARELNAIYKKILKFSRKPRWLIDTEDICNTDYWQKFSYVQHSFQYCFLLFFIVESDMIVVEINLYLL